MLLLCPLRSTLRHQPSSLCLMFASPVIADSDTKMLHRAQYALSGEVVYLIVLLWFGFWFFKRNVINTCVLRYRCRLQYKAVD